MNPKLLQLLRDPFDHSALELETDALVNRATGRRYAIAEGIPALLVESDLGPQNLKIRAMYSYMAGGFDWADRFGNCISLGGITKVRRKIAGALKLKAGERCLYTSIGTGLDLPFLAEQTPLDGIELVGLDLSREMLRQCQKKISLRWPGPTLVQANAERLPFADQAFDKVFHLGGINLFDRPAEAAREMTRVAKPGALILICDETKEVVEKHCKKYNPFTREVMKGMRLDFDPQSWPPAGSTETAYEETRMMMGFMGGYVLTFKAPPTDAPFWKESQTSVLKTASGG